MKSSAIPKHWKILYPRMDTKKKHTHIYIYTIYNYKYTYIFTYYRTQNKHALGIQSPSENGNGT